MPTMAERLGRYQVVKHLTSGGMAEVLLGRSDGIEGFERHVVLKRIRPEHARDERFISMFLDEARLAAGLHHQHIVQVFDIGEDEDGEFFFAMEYIHGEDLRKMLSAAAKAKTHIPLPFVCSILAATASGLHYAHERKDSKGKPLNIVHRDVSPSNILVGYDGSVKVLDFGIAKATLRTAETVVGSLKGKSSYMSPEQCKGQKIDRRSDVYGLGVLLYELATTTRLFKGDNEYLVMDAIVNGKFALPQVRRPDLPNELCQIIMTALAVDPDRRYQTADELRMALDQFAANYELASSTSAISTYMRKVFGERPEPWLERGSQRDIEAEIMIQRGSWADLSSGSKEDIQRNPTKTERRSRPMSNVAGAAGTSSKISPYDTTGPSVKFGWEASAPAQALRNNKLLWIGAPALAIAAFSIWKLTSDKDSAPKAAAQTVAMQTMPAAAPMPAPAPLPAPVAAPVAAPAPAAAPVTAEMTVEAPKKITAKQDAPKQETAAPKQDAPKQVKKAVQEKSEAPAKTEKVAVAAAVPAPVAAPQPAPAPAPAPVAAPAPAPAPAPTQAITAAPAPKEIEAQIPSLSNATVAAAASDHAKQLSTCEGTADLHGDVAVTFQIDASGKVVKSQLSSTIKNPKVAGCILKSVQSWKFPRPMAGAAKGVYTISYQ